VVFCLLNASLNRRFKRADSKQKTAERSVAGFLRSAGAHRRAGKL
jgi:hypothetical protein